MPESKAEKKVSLVKFFIVSSIGLTIVVLNALQSTWGALNTRAQVKGAMSEQQEDSKQITSALHTMNSSEEMTASNRAILDQVRSLQTATSAMKQSIEQVRGSAESITRNGQTLNELAGRLGASIGEIGEQIDEFKV